MKTPHADLTNLYPYCDYEMRVCVYNAMGDGYDTDIVACQTLEDGNHRIHLTAVHEPLCRRYKHI